MPHNFTHDIIDSINGLVSGPFVTNSEPLVAKFQDHWPPDELIITKNIAW